MNRRPQIALVICLLSGLFSCKSNRSTKSPSTPLDTTTSQAETLSLVGDVMPAPFVDPTSFEAVSFEVRSVPFAQIDLARIEVSTRPEGADYFEYTICDFDVLSKCNPGLDKPGAFALGFEDLPQLQPGKWMITLRACTRKSTNAVENCGAFSAQAFDNSQARTDAKLAKLLIQQHEAEQKVLKACHSAYVAVSIYNHKNPTDNPTPRQKALQNLQAIGEDPLCQTVLNGGLEAVDAQAAQAGKVKGLGLADSQKQQKTIVNDPLRGALFALGMVGMFSAVTMGAVLESKLSRAQKLYISLQQEIRVKQELNATLGRTKQQENWLTEHRAQLEKEIATNSKQLAEAEESLLEVETQIESKKTFDSTKTVSISELLASIEQAKARQKDILVKLASNRSTNRESIDTHIQNVGEQKLLKDLLSKKQAEITRQSQLKDRLQSQLNELRQTLKDAESREASLKEQQERARREQVERLTEAQLLKVEQDKFLIETKKKHKLPFETHLTMQSGKVFSGSEEIGTYAENDNYTRGTKLPNELRYVFTPSTQPGILETIVNYGQKVAGQVASRLPISTPSRPANNTVPLFPPVEAGTSQETMMEMVNKAQEEIQNFDTYNKRNNIPILEANISRLEKDIASNKEALVRAELAYNNEIKNIEYFQKRITRLESERAALTKELNKLAKTSTSLSKKQGSLNSIIEKQIGSLGKIDTALEKIKLDPTPTPELEGLASKRAESVRKIQSLQAKTPHQIGGLVTLFAVSAASAIVGSTLQLADTASDNPDNDLFLSFALSSEVKMREGIADKAAADRDIFKYLASKP